MTPALDQLQAALAVARTARRSVTIMLPLRTVNEMNDCTHWRNRQKRAKHARGLAALMVRHALVGCLPAPFPLVVTMTRIAPRDLDTDGTVASNKHVRDGIADALGIDDRSPLVRWDSAWRKSKSATPGGLRVVSKTGRVSVYAVEVEIAGA